MSLPTRTREGRILAGVCAGLGETYTLDPTLVRLAFLLLSLAWGIGLVLYGALWVLAPEEGAASPGRLRDVARRNLSGIGADLRRAGPRMSGAWRRFERHSWPRPFSRRWVAVALIAAGALMLLASLGAFSWLSSTRAIGLAVIAVGLAVLMTLRRR